jgi:hypothetical protein
MTPFLSLVLMFSLIIGNPPQEDPMAQCLKKSSSEWGSNCGSCYNSSKSYRINLKNVCSDNLDVKVAVQERSNRWRIFSQNNMAPNDTISSYACEGTGKYIFWTRKTGDRTIEFPSDDEIQNMPVQGK